MNNLCVGKYILYTVAVDIALVYCSGLLSRDQKICLLILALTSVQLNALLHFVSVSNANYPYVSGEIWPNLATLILSLLFVFENDCCVLINDGGNV